MLIECGLHTVLQGHSSHAITTTRHGGEGGAAERGGGVQGGDGGVEK